MMRSKVRQIIQLVIQYKTIADGIKVLYYKIRCKFQSLKVSSHSFLFSLTLPEPFGHQLAIILLIFQDIRCLPRGVPKRQSTIRRCRFAFTLFFFSQKGKVFFFAIVSKNVVSYFVGSSTDNRQVFLIMLCLPMLQCFVLCTGGFPPYCFVGNMK